MRFINFFILSFFILSSLNQVDAVRHYDFPEKGHLTDDMKSFFHENGFILFDGYLSDQTCEELRQEGQSIIRETNFIDDNLPVFATSEDGNKLIREEYFLSSADKAKPFFEEGAFNKGKLTVAKEHAVNKIGHALAELNPKFKKVTFDPRIARIAKQLGLANPALAQSMMILKPQKIGGEVVAHQDGSFIYSEPNTCLGFWMPLEDATKANACLQAVPGSHKIPLFVRYVRQKSGGMKFVKLDNQHWPKADINIHEWFNYVPVRYKKFVSLEMKKGSLIVFGGNLIHKSDPNKSEKSRNAYTFHVVDANATWPKENWLQRDKFVELSGK